jgi:anti-anti-sigma regulatory factor
MKLRGVAMSTDSVVLHQDSVCRIEKSTNPAGLRLYGSLDLDARSILDRELEGALRDGRDLYVDLSHLDFIEVGCMRTLLDVAAHLELDGCRLVLFGPSLAVLRIIAVCQETAPRNVEILPCPT